MKHAAACQHSCAAQRVPAQQLDNVHELKQELTRLRHEGQAYQDDLKRQLDGAKQAAMQARHEAGQAHARAAHETSLVGQLQDDKKRLSDIVDSWKRQGHEQQVWKTSRDVPRHVCHESWLDITQQHGRLQP